MMIGVLTMTKVIFFEFPDDAIPKAINVSSNDPIVIEKLIKDDYPKAVITFIKYENNDVQVA